MKKKLLISIGISTVLTINLSYGQSPIITSANQLHAIGDSTEYIDANSFGFDPIPAGGVNVSWTYGSLVTSGGIIFSYVNPATAPSAIEYPTANEAMANSQSAGHEWFLSSPISIIRLGYSDPTNGDIIYRGGGFVRYQFPFQAGDSWFTTAYNGSTTMTFGLGEDSTVVENGNYSASVDAYGTITLPTGVIYNAVRVHVLESFDLNIYIYGVAAVTQSLQDDYYFWFDDSIKDPVLIYGTTTSGSSVTKVLRYQPVGAPVGIEEGNPNQNISVYPNPSNGIFDLGSSNLKNEQYDVKVVNVLGETVYEDVINGNDKNIQIDLSNNNKGIYFLSFTNANHQIIKKIIIK